ncbi:unnamed protein product [Brassicogethes aeneus]|uniref:Uncharacterized protein n=1 Tax=Brassicogethes aeneus TaxID=1431903 RepID=A0A9P0FIJ0_BRAAE|nr:unnamed protein product [Brassicogethes aeneus]
MNMKFLCVVVATFAMASAEYSGGLKDALDIYRECSKSEGFSPCLKKKAIGVLDRLGRMQQFNFGEGVSIVHEPQTAPVESIEQLEANLPRALDAKDAALSDIALNKVSQLLGTSNIQISLSRFIEDDSSEMVEESRKKKGGKKGMMGDIGMLIAAKLAAILPLKIALIFFIAKKALIIAKIALLISGALAIKKLLASKGGSGGHGGGSSGWQSSGGGWDKRSMEEAQNLAYNAYKPQQ